MRPHNNSNFLFFGTFEIRWLGVLVMLLASTATVSAAPASFTVLDGSGAPFPKVLVIVTVLDNNSEKLRTLTDERGMTSQIDLPPGAYRVIATYPYGLWKTQVSEFAVNTDTFNLTLKMQILGTQDDVAYVGAPVRLVQIRDRKGEPVAGVTIIARNGDATREVRYETDKLGRARVGLIDESTTIVVTSGPFVAARTIESEHGGAKQTESKAITVEIP